MEWFIDVWPKILSLSAFAGMIGAFVRYGPKTLRRMALLLDCELDRLRWEEADKLRNREIHLLRVSVDHLQTDIDRLLAKTDRDSRRSSVGSGADFGTNRKSVETAPFLPTNPSASSES